MAKCQERLFSHHQSDQTSEKIVQKACDEVEPGFLPWKFIALPVC